MLGDVQLLESWKHPSFITGNGNTLETDSTILENVKALLVSKQLPCPSKGFLQSPVHGSPHQLLDLRPHVEISPKSPPLMNTGDSHSLLSDVGPKPESTRSREDM